MYSATVEMANSCPHDNHTVTKQRTTNFLFPATSAQPQKSRHTYLSTICYRENLPFTMNTSSVAMDSNRCTVSASDMEVTTHPCALLHVFSVDELALVSPTQRFFSTMDQLHQMRKDISSLNCEPTTALHRRNHSPSSPSWKLIR